MTDDRHEFFLALAKAHLGAAAGQALSGDTARAGHRCRQHSGARRSDHWQGDECIAMLLYPGCTALDLVGPQYMLSQLPGARLHLVARTLDPVCTDTGITLVPTMTMADCPRELDILFVPGGGAGILAAMKDDLLLHWLATIAAGSDIVASVGNGALLLGQAGLLEGALATSHWATQHLLEDYGATPIDVRVVWDGKLVTAAGVTAGLDLGLAIVARLRDQLFAQCVQLLAEYAPQPGLNAGTPSKAPLEATLIACDTYSELIDAMRAVGPIHRCRDEVSTVQAQLL